MGQGWSSPEASSPPDRPVYRHEKEGWHGWVAEKDSEPDPSQTDLRAQAHCLLWDAVDYIVSVEADAFFPGFDNDGSGWPDFSSLVMGHRLYKIASSRTYRPHRKYLAELFSSTGDHLYRLPRNWTLKVREHLNRSTTEDGILHEFHQLKMKSYLSHPIPECSCILQSKDVINSEKGSNLQNLYKCPQSLEQSVGSQESNSNDAGLQDDETDMDLPESGEIQPDTVPSADEGEEMDPDD